MKPSAVEGYKEGIAIMDIQVRVDHFTESCCECSVKAQGAAYFSAQRSRPAALSELGGS